MHICIGIYVSLQSIIVIEIWLLYIGLFIFEYFCGFTRKDQNVWSVTSIPLIENKRLYKKSNCSKVVYGCQIFISATTMHRWALQGVYHVFTVVMVIYHYFERIWIIIVTPIFNITYMIINIYYPYEPVNIHIQSFINIIQEKIG